MMSVAMLMKDLQIGCFLVDDNDRRTLFHVVVMTAFPVLFGAALAIPEETNAVDDQQLAAVLLRW